MEQQHARKREHVGSEQSGGHDAAVQSSSRARSPVNSDTTRQDDLAIEEFELDDIEEIESKVFA